MAKSCRKAKEMTLLEQKFNRESNHVVNRASLLWYLCPGPAWLSKLLVENAIKIAFAVLGLIAELFSTLFDENGEFVPEHLDNYAHTVRRC